MLSRCCSRLLQNRQFVACIDFIIDGASLLTRWVGKLFVVTVLVLTSLVMASYYCCLIPYLLDLCSEFWVLFHLVLGHYLLVNITFHYVMAVRTNPGVVINSAKVDPKDVAYYRRNYTTRICKHCHRVKPPRAYHCSICRQCVIKMEHHCPWINNCVGVLNHKFYLLFCWFMWVGTGYMLVSLWPLFSNIYRSKSYHPEVFGDKNAEIQEWLRNYFSRAGLRDALEGMNSDSGTYMNYSKYSAPLKFLSRYNFKNVLIFSFIICLSVFVALAILTIWQSWLVCFGETSVERMKSHNDRSECRRRNTVYKSPYHYGCLNNWKALLGFKDWWGFGQHVLLPSKNRGHFYNENLKFCVLDQERLL